MKRLSALIVTLFLCSCGTLNESGWPSQAYRDQHNYEAVITAETFERYPESFEGKIDESPRYPGGAHGLITDIVNNFNYPEAARMQGLEGKVYVKFRIRSDGYIDQIEVVKSPDPIFDEEAIKAVKSQKRWIPGKLNSEYVDFNYVQPLNLKLE